MLRIFLFIILISTTALAAEKPSELSGFVKANSPYGSGSLKKFIFHAYDAALWTDAEKWGYSAPFALSLTYKMSFTSEELVERTFDEMNADENINKKFAEKLHVAFPDVKDGDRITALFIPQSGIKFFYNGKLKQEIYDINFSKKFLDIWLSKTTSEPELRKELLKGES